MKMILLTTHFTNAKLPSVTEEITPEEFHRRYPDHRLPNLYHEPHINPIWMHDERPPERIPNYTEIYLGDKNE